MPRCHDPARPDACRLCRRYESDPAFKRMLDVPVARGSCRTGCGCWSLPGPVVVPDPPALGLNPRSDKAVVTVVVGPQGKALHAASGGAAREYADRVGADYVILDWPGHPSWPMSAKYAIPSALEYYDRIAYVDADVALRPGCLDLFDQCDPREMGVVDELPFHAALGHRLGREYVEFRARMGFNTVPNPPWYFNAGVMVVPRSHRPLLMPPAGPIQATHGAEQHHTNAMLLDSGMPFKLLDRRCNWQNWTDPGFREAPPDAVLHFSGGGEMRKTRVRDLAGVLSCR